MKKMIAIALVLMLCVSALSVTAFAASTVTVTAEVPAEASALLPCTGIPGVDTWDPASATGDLTEVSDGIWEKTIVCTAGTSMKFKVAGNDAWDNSCNFGTGEALALGTVTELPINTFGGDMTFTAEKDMTIKITVDLTAETATILVAEVAPQGGESGGETVNPGTGDMSLAAVSVALLAATAGLVVTVSKKKEF